MRIDRVRSVLYLPASNARAIQKARTLDCDVAVLDLEDAVAPEAKADARAAAVQAVRDGVARRKGLTPEGCRGPRVKRRRTRGRRPRASAATPR